MDYLKCKKTLATINANDNTIEEIENEFGEIDELFIASSDLSEMKASLILLKNNDFELAEEFLLSKNRDFCLWVLADNGILTQLPNTFHNAN